MPCRQDMAVAGSAFDFSHLLVIMKVHVGDGVKGAKGEEGAPKGKKNKGAAGTADTATAGSGSDATIYANNEEEALCEVRHFLHPLSVRLFCTHLPPLMTSLT